MTAIIPIELIHPHPSNPRRDLGNLDELADSIRAQGVRQNLLVVPASSDALTIEAGRTTRYTVVIGHRRLAAAKQAGLAEVPCIVDADLGLQQQIELMLVENLHRADLTPIEEATGYQDLLDLGQTEADIQKTTGRARATVKARLRLLTLPEAAQTKIHTREATLEDATRLEKLITGAAAYPQLAAEAQQLAAALGTRDFDWRAKSLASSIESYQAAVKLGQKLTDAGVPEVTAAEQVDSKDWLARSLWDAKEVDAAIKRGIPDGAVWVAGRTVQLLTPEPTDDQKAAAVEAAASRRAEQARIDAEATTAYELCEVFLCGWLGHAKVTTKERDHIIATLLPAYLDCSSYVGRYDRDYWLEEAEIPEDSLSPLQLLVVQVHSLTKYGWRAHTPLLLGLYETLTGLGYIPSDVEQTWIETAATKRAAVLEEQR